MGYTTRSGQGSTVETLTSSYDVALTRIMVDVDVFAWLMTSLNDVRMTSLGVLRDVAGVCDDHWHVEGKPETQAAHGGACYTQ